MVCTWQLGLPFIGNWETMRVGNPARRGIIHRLSASVGIAFKYKGSDSFAKSLQYIHFSIVIGVFSK